jgi:hypothetical protein
MGAVVARPQDTERRVETSIDDTFDNSLETSPDDKDSFGGRASRMGGEDATFITHDVKDWLGDSSG